MARSKTDLKFAVVVGVGEFPFDMLRYDECWPALEEQTRSLAEIPMKPGGLATRRIVLAKRNGEFNPARWRSFTWDFVFPGFDCCADAERWIEEAEEQAGAKR